MIAGLEERTRVAFPDDPTATHLDYVELWQEGGATIRKLAEELSAPVETPEDPDCADTEDIDTSISGAMLARYLDKTFGADEVERRLVLARKRGARLMNDEALSIADGVKHKDDVPAARLQVSTRNWTAERWNREAFGQSRGDTFNVLTVGQLHLAALQAVAQRRLDVIAGDGNG